MPAGNVSPRNRPVAKHVACDAISRGLASLVASGVTVAQISGVAEVSPRTISNALDGRKGHLLEFDTISTIAAEWPQFGSDVMQPARLRCTRTIIGEMTDAEWLAEAAGFSAELALALANGHVDHREVCRLAERAKRLAPGLDSFTERAANLRSVTA